FRIASLMQPQTETDAKISSAVAQRLKLMSGLDISERRLPQDGRFNVKVREQHIDVRISSMPTQYGETIVKRLLHRAGGLHQLDDLGMSPEMLERFSKAIHRYTGMVLVTGPTGSGKTTTLYAALNELNKPDCKIITVEDPVEYRLDGLNQVQVNEKIELTFGRVLRSSLRQDPDVILIGEMRDLETAEIGLRAAITGHMVLSTRPRAGSWPGAAASIATAAAIRGESGSTKCSKWTASSRRSPTRTTPVTSSRLPSRGWRATNWRIARLDSR